MIMIMAIVIKGNYYYAKQFPRILWCFFLIFFITLTILYLEECQITFAIIIFAMTIK